MKEWQRQYWDCNRFSNRSNSSFLKYNCWMVKLLKVTKKWVNNNWRDIVSYRVFKTNIVSIKFSTIIRWKSFKKNVQFMRLRWIILGVFKNLLICNRIRCWRNRICLIVYGRSWKRLMMILVDLKTRMVSILIKLNSNRLKKLEK